MILVLRGGQAVPITRGKQMTGEKIPGDLKSWDYFGTDPNELLLYNYDELQGRATTLYHTHGPVTSAINIRTHYAIGHGLVFRSQPDWKTLEIDQKKAEEWGQRFQKLIHYSFKLLNYYEKQSILYRTKGIMGDSLLLFDRQENPFEGVPFDLIETGGDSIDFRKTNKENCTLGIYHDKYKRRQGVALYDKERINFRDKNQDQNIIQVFDRLMARQLRGYPLSYRIIAAAKNNDRWWDAMLARAVLEATVFASAKENVPGSLREQAAYMQDKLLDENGNRTNPSSSTTLTRENVTELGSGNVFSGGAVEFTTPKTPADNFDKMQTAFIDIVGMATDTPPEFVMRKYSTSYTARMGASNDFEKSYMFDRASFVDNVNYIVILELAKYFFMNGIIEMLHPAFFNNAIIQRAVLGGFWMGPVPGFINPKQEVDALVIARDNGFITPADAAYSYGQGGEFEDFIEEWGLQMEKWKSKSPDQQKKDMAEEVDEINQTNLEDDSEDDEEVQE